MLLLYIVHISEGKLGNQTCLHFTANLQIEPGVTFLRKGFWFGIVPVAWCTMPIDSRSGTIWVIKRKFFREKECYKTTSCSKDDYNKYPTAVFVCPRGPVIHQDFIVHEKLVQTRWPEIFIFSDIHYKKHDGFKTHFCGVKQRKLKIRHLEQRSTAFLFSL